MVDECQYHKTNRMGRGEDDVDIYRLVPSSKKTPPSVAQYLGQIPGSPLGPSGPGGPLSPGAPSLPGGPAGPGGPLGPAGPGPPSGPGAPF